MIAALEHAAVGGVRLETIASGPLWKADTVDRAGCPNA
jgi:hypothetical protein